MTRHDAYNEEKITDRPIDCKLVDSPVVSYYNIIFYPTCSHLTVGEFATSWPKTVTGFLRVQVRHRVRHRPTIIAHCEKAQLRVLRREGMIVSPMFFVSPFPYSVTIQTADKGDEICMSGGIPWITLPASLKAWT